MKQKIVLKYKPNERQAEFHRSGEDYVVYGGARRWWKDVCDGLGSFYVGFRTPWSQYVYF